MLLPAVLTCVICGMPFEARSFAAKACPGQCRADLKSQRQHQYEVRNAEQRRAYAAAYYLAHREERNAKAIERAKLRREQPGVAKLLNERNKEYRKAERAMQRRAERALLRKVMNEWQVGPEQARQWIEAGSFPP